MLRSVLLIFFLTISSAAFSNENIGASGDIAVSEDNLLIVEIYINKSSTGEAIEIFQYDGGYLVPIGILSDIVEFSIDVDADDGVARGWFLKENRIFELNTNKNKVIIEGREENLDPGLVVSAYDDIYVDSSLFSKWFPIDFKLNFPDLVLYLNPREKLPIQIKLEREKLHKKVQLYRPIKKNYKPIENPYELLDFPVLDIDVGYNFSNTSNPQSRANYSVLSRGDLGYLTANTVFSGDSGESLNNAHIDLGRKDHKKRLLGRLNASEFKFGDINSVPLPITTSSSRGRGIIISNANLKRSDRFDTTSFIGDSLPGWEIEIYRNGSLLDFQIIGDDSRYEFNDIPIFFGNNVFRVVSYGPQGQIRERTETFLIDNSVLQKGEFNYRVSADEKSRSVFGVYEDKNLILHNNGVRLVGAVEYGVMDNVTAVFGLVRTPLEDFQVHNYQSFGLRNSFKSMLSSWDFVYDSKNKGWASKITANTRFKNINIRASHSNYKDFVSEVERVGSSSKNSESKVAFDGSLPFLINPRISYRLSGQVEKLQNKTQIVTLENRLSTSIYGVNISNNIQSRGTTNGANSVNLVNGNFAVRGRYKKIILRLSTAYELDPTNDIRSVNFSLQKQLGRGSNIRAGVVKNLGESAGTSFNGSLNKRFDKFILSGLIGADDSDNFSAGMKISFSLGREPRTKKWIMDSESIASDGAISARAFLDNNYNGLFDEDDEIIENAGFRVNHAKFAGNGDQPVILNRLDDSASSDIFVDLASLEDPFWVAKDEGYAVLSRPGKILEVDFAIISTTEIDGNIYVQSGDFIKTVSRAQSELVNAKGEVVATTKSEFDGFYLFEKVIPGSYKIRLSKASLAKLRAENNPSETVEISPESDIISAVDLVVQR